MIKYLAQKIIGNYNDRYIKRINPVIQEINSKEGDISKLSNEDLADKTFDFKELLAHGKGL